MGQQLPRKLHFRSTTRNPRLGRACRRTFFFSFFTPPGLGYLVTHDDGQIRAAAQSIGLIEQPSRCVDNLSPHRLSTHRHFDARTIITRAQQRAPRVYQSNLRLSVHRMLVHVLAARALDRSGRLPFALEAGLRCYATAATRLTKVWQMCSRLKTSSEITPIRKCTSAHTRL